MDEDIKVRLIGDPSSLEAASKKSVSALDNISKASNNTAQQLSKTSSQISQAASNMARGAAAAGGAVVKSTKDFTGLSRVLQDLPFGFIAISNNLTQLLPAAGGLGLAFSALVSVLTFAQTGLSNWTRGLGATKAKIDEVRESLKDVLKPIEEIRAGATGDSGGEIAQVQALANVVLNQTESYEKRNRALNELKEINKGYFGDLTLEADKLKTLQTRVEEYSNALIAQAVVKAFADDIGKLTVELAKQQIPLAKLQSEYSKLGKSAKQAQADANKLQQGITGGGTAQAPFVNTTEQIANKALSEAKKSRDAQLKLVNEISTQKQQLTDALQGAVNESLKFKPLKTPDTPKGDKPKFEFLYDFLPFDPSGKLKPEQRATLLNNIDKFSKEFQGILKGIDFTHRAKTEDEKIQLALQFDAKLKAGKVELDTKSLTDSINKSLQFEDLIPQISIDTSVIQKFIKGFQVESERIVNANPFNLPFNFNITTDLPAQIEIFKTRIKQLGGEIPKAIEGIGIQGQPVVISVDDLIDTSKISNADALKALDLFIKNFTGKIGDFKEQVRGLVESTKEGLAINIGEGIAEAISGDGLQQAFGHIAVIMGDFIQSLGKLLIKEAIQVEAFKKAFAALLTNPIAAVAVGIGLVALGGIIKNTAMPKPKGFQRGEREGLIPGTGSVDSVPIMATPGELIVSKKWALPVLQWLRTQGQTMGLPRMVNNIPAFATGGVVTSNTIDRVSNTVAAPMAFPSYLPAFSMTHDQFRMWYKRAETYGNNFGR